MSFTANASEAMRIISSGNVGIGVTNPGLFRLAVEQDGSTFIVASFGNTAADAEIRIGTGDTTSQSRIGFSSSTDGDVGLIAYDHTGDFMSFTTNTVEAMRINSSGDIGIGTSSPTGRLHMITYNVP